MEWRPRNTANGWYPKLSPSGRYVVYGFWETSLADLHTGQEWPIQAPTGARLNPLGFIDEETIIAATETGPAAVYRISVKDRVPVDLGVPPEHATHNWGNAKAGHWGLNASFRTYCIKDGQPFRQDVNPQYGIYVAGNHLLTSDKASVIYHFVGNNTVRTVPMDNQWVVNEHGDIATGYYGVLHVYPWGQGHVDGTITPWRREGVPALVRVNGELWVWNASDDNSAGEMVVMGRRLGETQPITLRNFPAVHVDAVFNGSEWIVAGNDDKGRLQVRSVAMNAPRVDLNTLVKPIAATPPKPKEEVKTEEPKPTMQLPERAKEIVVALYERNKDLAGGNDDQRRVLTKKIAEQVRLELGSEWGWKSAHSNLSSPSKDAIAFVRGGGRHGERQNMFAFDLFDGTSREPHENPHGEATSQWFIEVSAVDHLGSDGPSEEEPAEMPEPTIPPTTPNDELDPTGLLELVVAQISAELQKVVEAQIQLLRKELDDLTFEGRNRLLGTITFTRKKQG